MNHLKGEILCDQKQSGPLIVGMKRTASTKLNIFSSKFILANHQEVFTEKVPPKNLVFMKPTMPKGGARSEVLMDRRLLPPTKFEKKLNQTIAWYARQGLLAMSYFDCSECETLNFRPVPRDLEHAHCCRCGRLNDWEAVESSLEFGGTR